MFVDSSFLVGLARGHDEAVRFYRANEHEEMSATTIAAYELFGGLVDRDVPELVDELRRDLGWVDFVPFELSDAAETARLDAELAADGTRIPAPDVMVAAAARDRNETLVGADERFDRVRGLEYVDFRQMEE